MFSKTGTRLETRTSFNLGSMHDCLELNLNGTRIERTLVLCFVTPLFHGLS